MSNLQTQIRDDMKTAMKAHDKQRTGTLRMFIAALTAEETSGARHKLDDDEVLKVLAREIKKRKESAQVYADAGRQELADQELAEVAVLEEYQPTQLTDDEVTALVQAAITDVAAGGDISMKLMGPVMQQVTQTAAGRRDGKRLSAAVRAALQ